MRYPNGALPIVGGGDCTAAGGGTETGARRPRANGFRWLYKAAPARAPDEAGRWARGGDLRALKGMGFVGRAGV
jgi:hypothetical protein